MSKVKKILAIEDDEFMKIFLRDVFWIHGFHETHSLNIVENVGKAEALLKDENVKPDLIFLDVMSASNRGWNSVADMEARFQFLKKIKADKATKNTKVIIFSTYSDGEIESRALKLGADKFLVKGECMPEDFVKIVREFLGD